MPDNVPSIVYLLSAKKNWWYFLPAFAWGTLIFVVISIPPDRIPQSELFQFPHFDKVVHFAMFAVFGVLLLIGFANNMGGVGQAAAWKIFSASLFAGILFGIITEYVQFCCIYGRHGNMADALTNSFGTIFGVFIMAMIRRKRRLKS